MTDLHSFWNRAFVQLIRDAVCTVVGILDMQSSISIAKPCMPPFPAGIGIAWNDILPELLFNRLCASRLIRATSAVAALGLMRPMMSLKRYQRQFLQTFATALCSAWWRQKPFCKSFCSVFRGDVSTQGVKAVFAEVPITLCMRLGARMKLGDGLHRCTSVTPALSWWCVIAFLARPLHILQTTRCTSREIPCASTIEGRQRQRLHAALAGLQRCFSARSADAADGLVAPSLQRKIHQWKPLQTALTRFRLRSSLLFCAGFAQRRQSAFFTIKLAKRKVFKAFRTRFHTHLDTGERCAIGLAKVSLDDLRAVISRYPIVGLV